VVVAMTVIHHSNDPDALIREIFRLAKKRILIMESVVEGLTEEDRKMEFLICLWIDWFYNRVIHYSPNPEDKIPVPGNYDSRQGWVERIRRLTGLQPAHIVNYSVFQWLNPEHHALLVYK